MVQINSVQTVNKAFTVHEPWSIKYQNILHITNQRIRFECIKLMFKAPVIDQISSKQ